MKRRDTKKTAHIQLDPHRCQACWKCVNACPKQVLGKVDFPFHKHAKVVNPDECIGCKKCVKTCPHGAIEALE
ncbi:MAG: 4Fe-4S binding protein [Muribaculaceae bacterium]|nr:4Fe-4S binding protein [Muribaculaceae bacterium]